MSVQRLIGEAATNRRDLLEALAATAGLTVAGVAVASALTPLDRLLALDRTASGSGGLALVDVQLESIVADYPTTPPTVLLGRIAEMQQVTDALGQLSLRPADQARLWRQAGIGAGLRGWVHNNAGQTDAARLSLAEAFRRGELLEDPQLMAWTRYMQGIVEDYAGNPRGAEEYALDGLRYAPSGPQRAILLTDGVAWARAEVGDADGAVAAIDEAGAIVASLTPQQRGPIHATIVHDLDSYHPVSFGSAAATAFAYLGRPDDVREFNAIVTSAAGTENVHQRSYVRLDEAMAVIRSKNPDPARVSALALEGLDLATPFQTAHVGRRLDLILTDARPFASDPPIRDLTDAVTTWRNTPTLAS